MEHNECVKKIVETLKTQKKWDIVYADLEDEQKPSALQDTNGNDRMPDVMAVKFSSNTDQNDLQNISQCVIYEVKEYDDFFSDEERSRGQLEAYTNFASQHNGRVNLIFTERLNALQTLEVFAKLREWGFIKKVNLLDRNCNNL